MPTLRSPELLLGALLAVSAGVLAPAPALLGQDEEAPADAETGAQARFLVEVVDDRGEPLSGLAPGDFEVRVDGEPRAVTALTQGRPERIVVLFDLGLLSTGGVVAAAGVLGDRAAELAEVAPVELALADEGTRTVLPATRDRELLSQAFAGIGVRNAGEAALDEVRRGFLDELAGSASLGLRPDGPRRSPQAEDRAAAAARRALTLEAEVLRRQRERLIAWAADARLEGPPAEPAALVLVTGAFGEDPLDFYRAALEAYGLGSVAERLERPVVLPSLSEVGRVLAAYGWLTFPYLPAAEEPEAGSGAPAAAREPLDDLPRAGADPTEGGDPSRPALITPRLGRRGAEPSGAEALPSTRSGPEAPAALAAATGGEVVTDALQLRNLVGRLGSRWSVSFLAPVGEPRAVEVRSERGGATVRAPAWAGTVAPGSVATVRVRRLLAGELPEEGALPVEAAFEAAPSGLGEGFLTVRLEPSDEDAERPPAAGLRATVGIAREGREPLVFHRELEVADATGEDLFRFPVTLPEGGESRVAVLVEELPGGRWGAAFASYLEPEPGRPAVTRGSELLPSPRVVRLLDPADPFVMGETELEAVISDPAVTRVDFLVDGERRVVRGAPPYRGEVDLGDLPRPRRIEAVAYDAEGRELGRDLLVVNRGSGSFRVRIVEPTGERAGTRDAPRTGVVDVTAEVAAPPDARVERVDFYWNAAHVATRYAPPYRQPIVVPPEAPQGFVRVVARLEEGTAAEDVVFLNSPGTAERLDVNLVEMYVVVTDEQGRPVSGLGPEDFRVFEEGDAREIATFSDARSLPLTVGLVIDSSASMFVKLPSVGQAAARFVREDLGGGDRAFVVGFGNHPALAQETTSDDSRLTRAIAGLRADGQTAIWESLVYSLVQIQGAPGKKALIVYTDGADEDEDFPYETAYRFARRTGVPIYFILTNNEIVRTGGKGLGVRRFLSRVRRLADAVGGNIYIVRHGEDLTAIYAEIAEELRSQYLLAYYSDDLPEETFRRVRVGAVDPKLRVRTIAGYFK
jgi:Ca-activated chloride channel family protein